MQDAVLNAFPSTKTRNEKEQKIAEQKITGKAGGMRKNEENKGNEKSVPGGNSGKIVLNIDDASMKIMGGVGSMDDAGEEENVEVNRVNDIPDLRAMHMLQSTDKLSCIILAAWTGEW